MAYSSYGEESYFTAMKNWAEWHQLRFMSDSQIELWEAMMTTGNKLANDELKQYPLKRKKLVDALAAAGLGTPWPGGAIPDFPDFFSPTITEYSLDANDRLVVTQNQVNKNFLSESQWAQLYNNVKSVYRRMEDNVGPFRYNKGSDEFTIFSTYYDESERLDDYSKPFAKKQYKDETIRGLIDVLNVLKDPRAKTLYTTRDIAGYQATFSGAEGSAQYDDIVASLERAIAHREFSPSLLNSLQGSILDRFGASFQPPERSISSQPHFAGVRVNGDSLIVDLNADYEKPGEKEARLRAFKRTFVSGILRDLDVPGKRSFFGRNDNGGDVILQFETKAAVKLDFDNRESDSKGKARLTPKQDDYKSGWNLVKDKVKKYHEAHLGKLTRRHESRNYDDMRSWALVQSMKDLKIDPTKGLGAWIEKEADIVKRLERHGGKALSVFRLMVGWLKEMQGDMPDAFKNAFRDRAALAHVVGNMIRRCGNTTDQDKCMVMMEAMHVVCYGPFTSSIRGALFKEKWTIFGGISKNKAVNFMAQGLDAGIKMVGRGAFEALNLAKNLWRQRRHTFKNRGPKEKANSWVLGALRLKNINKYLRGTIGQSDGREQEEAGMYTRAAELLIDKYRGTNDAIVAAAQADLDAILQEETDWDNSPDGVRRTQLIEEISDISRNIDEIETRINNGVPNATDQADLVTAQNNMATKNAELAPLDAARGTVINANWEARKRAATQRLLDEGNLWDAREAAKLHLKKESYAERMQWEMMAYWDWLQSGEKNRHNNYFKGGINKWGGMSASQKAYLADNPKKEWMLKWINDEIHDKQLAHDDNLLRARGGMTENVEGQFAREPGTNNEIDIYLHGLAGQRVP
jgi:hypothetical protein